MVDKRRDLTRTGGAVPPGTADVVRRIAVEESNHTATTASSDSVDALRRSVRDLKHDVRMLKVVVDKQSALIERLVDRLDA